MNCMQRGMVYLTKLAKNNSIRINMSNLTAIIINYMKSLSVLKVNMERIYKDLILFAQGRELEKC